MTAEPLRIAVCLKWVSLRPEVDPLSGAVSTDDRFSGVSSADQAALEWALRIRSSWARTDSAVDVVAVSAGPPPAERGLRDAIAAGADSAIRVELDPTVDSLTMARGLHRAIADADADLVLCGDWSADRGSGSVPAFLAALAEVPQALGLISITPARRGELVVERRLDFGRRERLAVTAPAILSVEGGTCQLRRAPLSAVLAARSVTIAVVPSPAIADSRIQRSPAAPYRPRARALAPPPAGLSARERILSLTGALVERVPPRTITTAPDEAASLIIDQLQAWGYLDRDVHGEDGP